MYYIVRHGQTEGNKKKTLQGRSNLPLNDEGKKQAEQLAAYFKEQGIVIHKVYSSPLIRAVDTAKIISGADQVVEDDRLLEMDYGPYEGIGLENPPKEIITFFSDFVHNPAPEGMESLQSVTERLGDFLESVKAESEENILISAHAISMKGALEYLTPESKGTYWSKYIANCGVYGFDVENGEYTVPEEIKYIPDREDTPGV